ncbi:unnamed protein product, partial [Ascophyllum nodosum]
TGSSCGCSIKSRSEEKQRDGKGRQGIPEHLERLHPRPGRQTVWSRAVVQDTEGWIRGNCAERHLSDTCSNAEADPVQALRGDVPKRARVLGAPENAT